MGCGHLVSSENAGMTDKLARGRYTAPELFGQVMPSGTNPPTDVYSLGMTLYALGSPTEPFDGKRGLEAAKDAKDGKRPAMPVSLGGLGPIPSKELWDLLVEMWDPDPAFRPKAVDVESRLHVLLEASGGGV